MAELPDIIRETGEDLGELCARKNIAYGDAAGKSAGILRILYPEGIPADTYEHSLLLIRVLDKLCRISTGDPESLGRVRGKT